jgi:hypothetical protein
MVPEFPRGEITEIAMIPDVVVVAAPIHIDVPVSMVEIVSIEGGPPIIMACSSL